MNLRLLKVLVARDDLERALEILDEHEAGPRWCVEVSEDRVSIDLLQEASGSEPLLDALEDEFREREEFRILSVALEATVPRLDSESEEGEGREGRSEGVWGLVEGDEDEKPRRIPLRINREELYDDMESSSRATPVFVIMVALSSVVASAGLVLGDGAVIIGAMVIAPLIGPSMGLSFATTLGDLELGRGALKASAVGVLTAFVVALLAGGLLEVDPTGDQIFGRTRLTYEQVALALAAGAAGALSLTQGKGAGLVGVMVAVALLPPLANAGLLIGDGHWQPGVGAMVLVAGNVVCVHLAATATFLLQGVRPNTWWEEGRRKKAVWVAAILWGVLLALLLLVVWLAWGGERPGSPG